MINIFFNSEDENTYVCVTRKDERPEIAWDKKANAKFEHLAQNFPNKAFDVFVMSTPSLSNLTQPTQHKGQEMIFILKGEIDFTVHEKEYHLFAGDSIFFNSTYTHFGRCTTDEGTEVLLITFDDSKKRANTEKNQ